MTFAGKLSVIDFKIIFANGSIGDVLNSKIYRNRIIFRIIWWN